MLRKLTDIVSYLIYFSILTAIIAATTTILKKEKSSYLRILSIYLIYCILSDLIFSKLSIKYFNTEIYAYRAFTIVEYFSLSFILRKFLLKKAYIKATVIFDYLFLVILLIDFYTNSFQNFDSMPTGIESVLILIISILVLLEKINNTELNFDISTSLPIGLILYFSGTFFLFILSQRNFSDNNFSETYAYLVAIFNILKNSLIFIGLISPNQIYFQRSILRK